MNFQQLRIVLEAAQRRRYRDDHAGTLQRNGGFLVHGYGTPMRRYALTPVDSPVHPTPPP